MWYEYRCVDCGRVHETQTFTHIGRALDGGFCQCGGLLQRIVSVPQVSPAAPEPYWNYTVGDYVTSTRDFERKLAEGQSRMSERLGYDQTFTPVYPSEQRAYVESTASADGEQGESLEKYARLHNVTNPDRTIIT